MKIMKINFSKDIMKICNKLTVNHKLSKLFVEEDTRKFENITDSRDKTI